MPIQQISGKLAYVMSRFPHLPETFILREMVELERQGWTIEIYPLLYQHQTVLHAEALPWLSKVQTGHFYSWGLFFENFKTFLRSPQRYLSSLWKLVWLHRKSRKFLLRALVIFPQAIAAGRTMQRHGISHIHAHYATHPALFAWIIRQWYGITYSVTVHAHDIFVDRTMLAQKLHSALFVVAISEYNRKFLEEKLGVWLAEKVQIVHCGIDASCYVPPARPLGTGERLELVSTGSLQPYKGHDFLIEAACILKSWGYRFRLRIIGEGQERPILEKQIKDLDLEGFVILEGAKTQAEVAEILMESDIYLQSSIPMANGKMEGIPVALMEAMACSLPVIATRLSGVPELVQDGVSGHLVPPGDSLSLASAVQTLVKDPCKAKELGEAGRQIVLDEFQLKDTVKMLARLFIENHAGRTTSLETSPASITTGVLMEGAKE